MKPDNHERAQQLLITARVEGITDSDDKWVTAHLSQCSDCSRQADALGSFIHALREAPVLATPDLVRRTSRAVQRRAAELQAERATAAPVWIAAVVSAVLVLLTAPYVWSAFGWIGRLAQVPDFIWQAGFLMWWFMPASVVGAVAVWRNTTKPRLEQI